MIINKNTTSTNPNIRAIYQRRNYEEHIDKLQTKLNQEFYEKQFAVWENRGQKVNQAKYMKQRLQQLREESQRQLNQRKQKLALLLAGEHEQHKQRIKDMQETTEDIRRKMLIRVKELQEQKENERLKFVAEKTEQQFIRNADELRKVDADFRELKTLHEQNIQIMEKQDLLKKQYEEEMIYSELYKIDIRRKEKEERIKEQERQQKVEERKKVLLSQLQNNQDKENYEKNLHQKEKQMLKEEWKKEEERHQKQQQDLNQFNKELNQEIKRNNEELQRRQEMEKKIEKIQDKEMVDKIILKEKMLDQLEAEQKRRFQEETKQFLLNFKNRSNEAHAYEAELDKLIQIEAEKQYQRQQAIWKKEMDARIKLMHEVYDNRKDNIELKQQLSQIEIEQKEIEKDILNKAVKAYEEECERKRLELYMTNKKYQGNLIGQMSEKERKKYEELQKKKEEEEQERLMQLDYERKIQQKKLEGKMLLEELRKKRPF